MLTSFVNTFVSPTQVQPHGQCLLWQNGLVWLHVVSDSIIALAYYSIPLALLYFVRKRRDLPFHWMFLLFGAFILACGTTHLMAIWTIWSPAYWLDGFIKAGTAATSLGTAILLWPLIPKALALPSPSQLASVNEELRREIIERGRVQQALQQARDTLEQEVAIRTRELVEANTALRESAGRLKAVVETAVDGIITIDDHGRIESVNPAVERLFGYAELELLGRNVNVLMPSPYREEHDTYVSNYVQGGKPKIIGIGREVLGLRKDGTIFPIELSVGEMKSPERRLFTGIIRDITERKRTEDERSVLLREAERREQELREKQAQLVQAAKLASIGELATGVAHELNNPLNNIGLFTGNIVDRLNSGQVDVESTKAALEKILVQVGKAATIVNHLRTFGRSATMERCPIRINEILAASVALMREQFRLKNIELIVDLSREDPMVLGNAIQLEQVFVNLLSNARDAVETADRKSVTVHSRVRSGHVEIGIRDTGTGIPPELLPRIFDPFFTTKHVGSGTGLGLSISYGIIQEHQGEIAVESRPGHGTAFVLKLPSYGAGAGRPGSA